MHTEGRSGAVLIGTICSGLGGLVVNKHTVGEREVCLVDFPLLCQYIFWLIAQAQTKSLPGGVTALNMYI